MYQGVNKETGNHYQGYCNYNPTQTLENMFYLETAFLCNKHKSEHVKCIQEDYKKELFMFKLFNSYKKQYGMNKLNEIYRPELPTKPEEVKEDDNTKYEYNKYETLYYLFSEAKWYEYESTDIHNNVSFDIIPDVDASINIKPVTDVSEVTCLKNEIKEYIGQLQCCSKILDNMKELYTEIITKYDIIEVAKLLKQSSNKDTRDTFDKFEHQLSILKHMHQKTRPRIYQ